MQLLRPHTRPTEEIKLKVSDEECLLRGEETSEPRTVAGEETAMLFVNQYQLNSSIQNPTKLQPPSSTAPAHEAAAVLCGSSSAPHLTRAAPLSPKQPRKPCGGDLKSRGTSNSSSALPHPSTTRQGLRGSERLRGTAQVTNRNQHRARIRTRDGFPSRVASGFTFTFSFFLPHVCCARTRPSASLPALVICDFIGVRDILAAFDGFGNAQFGALLSAASAQGMV